MHGAAVSRADLVGLPMCWPPPLPQPGHYICSGPRARFAYHIVIVERYKPPRSAKRYTCKLWCERLLVADLPDDAVVHRFYWHKRKRRQDH